MKTYTAQEVMADIAAFEGREISVNVPGLENAHFHELYSQVIEAPAELNEAIDPQERVMAYLTEMENVIPNTDVAVDPRFEWNVFYLDFVPQRLLDIFAAQARLVMKTDIATTIRSLVQEARHPFYIVVDTSGKTSYYDTSKINLC